MSEAVRQVDREGDEKVIHSYSDILTHMRCPKLYEFRVVRNLQKKLTAVPLTKGIFTHELLMGYYLDGPDGFQAAADRLWAAIQDFQVDDDIIEAGDLLTEAIDLVLRYLNQYDDEWEILHVEETFEAELEGHTISFTPDLVIRDSRGVWIVDHKTTQNVPSGAVPVGNYQAFLYSSVMRQIYPDFRGFLFNYLRKKVPTQPRLTKTGNKRVADLNRIDTTYEKLRDFLMEEAPDLLDDPAHRRRLAELRDTDRFFYREFVFVTDEMADEILEDTVQRIEDIERHREAGRFPRSFLPYAGAQECDNCEFKDLCVAELRGYNTEPVLVMFEPRDQSHRQYDFDLEEFNGQD